MIKKIVGLILIVSLHFSCSSDDEEVRNEYYLIPISSIELPEVWTFNQENTIKLRYIRPSTCYFFNNIYVNTKTANEIEFAIQVVKLEESTCLDTTNEGEYEVSYDFNPSASGSYKLKFLSNNGEYIEHIVEVN